MKVTKHILSIPPHLSTSWEHIAALRVEKEVLMVKLGDGSVVDIPGLSEEQLAEIFSAHTEFVERQSQPNIPLPFRLNPAGMMEGMPLQHDPSQSEAPDLPEEILAKISSVSQALGVNVSEETPEPEPGCNCFFCQIARAVATKAPEAEVTETEEEVSDEELAFREWDIAPAGKQLYTVTNPLDTNEKYSVFLGKPVGCTCGQPHCEHIKAVLNS